MTPRYCALSACSSWCPYRVYVCFTGVLFRVMHVTFVRVEGHFPFVFPYTKVYLNHFEGWYNLCWILLLGRLLYYLQTIGQLMLYCRNDIPWSRLLFRDHALVSRGHALVCRGHALVSRGHTIVCRGYALVSRNHAIASRKHEINKHFRMSPQRFRTN